MNPQPLIFNHRALSLPSYTLPHPPLIPYLSLSLSLMATTSLQSLHQPFHHHHHHHTFSTTPDSLRPTTPHKPFSSSSLLTASSVLTPATSSSFDALAHHLAAADFRQADEETRRLLIALAGEPAQKRGYVFFSEVQFISAADFRAIDRLWRRHSADRFGYSVQRRLWDKSERDFTRFFIRVGWMKKLVDTEVEHYNYCAFPNEFVWELDGDTPEGHLPLTNALRGTQLLTCILTHPAFDDDEEAGGENESSKEGREKPLKPSAVNRSLKADYSF